MIYTATSLLYNKQVHRKSSLIIMSITTPSISELQSQIHQLQQQIQHKDQQIKQLQQLNDMNVDELIDLSTIDHSHDDTGMSSTDTDHDSHVLNHDELIQLNGLQLIELNEFIDGIDNKKILIDHLYQQSMNKLIQRSHVNGSTIYTQYKQLISPYNQQLINQYQQLQSIMHNRYVEISAEKLDMLVLGYHKQTNSNTRYDNQSTTAIFTKSAIFHNYRINHPKSHTLHPASTYNTTVHDFDDDHVYVARHRSTANNVCALDSHTADTAFHLSMQSYNDEQRQNELVNERSVNETMRQTQKQIQAEQRADAALNIILPIAPYLTLEQAVIILEKHFDDTQQAANYLLTSDLDVVQNDIATYTAQQPNNNTNNHNSNTTNHSSSSTLSLQRTYSTPPTQSLIFRCTDVSTTTGEITLQCILTRDRTPVDSKQNSATLRLPLHNLLELGIKLCSNTDIICIEQDCTERVIQLTYTPLHDNQYLPLKLEPSGLRITSYGIDFITSQGVRAITHVTDGPVLFNAIQYTGNNPVNVSSAIKLYTSILDDNTINILHVHLDDLSDEISIDTIYLTNQQSINDTDVQQFHTDVTGRPLSYKIVVQHNRIIAVLHNSIDNNTKQHNITSSAFESITAPSTGDYVQLSGNRIAQIQSNTIGLIITSSPDNQQLNEYAKQQHTAHDTHLCLHKHPVDLHGEIQLDVIMENNKLLSQSYQSCIPVCRLTILNKHDAEQLIHHATQQQLYEIQQLPQLLAQYENQLNNLPAVPTTAQLDELQQLKHTITSLSQLTCAHELVSQLQNRISNANMTLARRIRAAALDRRALNN